MFCNDCKLHIHRNHYPSHIRSLQHKSRGCSSFGSGVELVNTAFKCRIASYRVSSSSSKGNHIEYGGFFSEIKNKVLPLLAVEVEKFKSIKTNFELFAYFIHQTSKIIEMKSFNTQNKIINEITDISDLYDYLCAVIEKKASEFQESGSGKLTYTL